MSTTRVNAIFRICHRRRALEPTIPRPPPSGLEAPAFRKASGVWHRQGRGEAHRLGSEGTRGVPRENHGLVDQVLPLVIVQAIMSDEAALAS